MTSPGVCSPSADNLQVSLGVSRSETVQGQFGTMMNEQFYFRFKINECVCAAESVRAALTFNK